MASCLRTAWCSCTLCECIPCGPALRAISSVDCALCARGRSVPLLGSITLSVCTVAVGGVGRGKEGPGLAPSSEATHTRTMLSTLSPGRSREVASPWPVASAQDELLTPSSPRGFEVPFFSTFVPPLPLPSPHMLLFTDLLEQCAKIIIMFYVLKKPWLCVVGETKGEQTQLLALAVASESQSHQGRGEPSWGAHRGGGGFPLHKGGARCPGSRSSVGTEGICPQSRARGPCGQPVHVSGGADAGWCPLQSSWRFASSVRAQYWWTTVLCSFRGLGLWS